MSDTAQHSGIFGWARQSNPERFVTFTLWSLYLLLAAGPWFAFLLLTGATDWRGNAAFGYVGASLVHLVATISMVRAAVQAYLGRSRVPRWRYVALAVSTVGSVAMAMVGYPSVAAGEPVAVAMAVVIPLGAALVSVAPLAPAGRLAWSVIPIAALALGAAALAGASPRALAALASGVAFLVFLAIAAARCSVWMLGVFWEQVRRREVDARLAVAEERLRFSRDLHDVFGRTLSVVAVKSELAAELARRGDPRAQEQMSDVRTIAQDALREVRAVVDGYRAADLPTELRGAAEILRSAGVSVRVVGEGLELPEQVQEGLAWAVREGVTNVVRHADARVCSIEVTMQTGSGAAVEIVNDGARAGAGVRAGAGLPGLRERLAAVGGTLHTALADGTFTLRASVPHQPQESA